MRRTAPLLLVLLGLALPGYAAAQSAGDNQYQDPFANQGPSGSQSRGGSSTGSAQGSGQTGAVQTAQGTASGTTAAGGSSSAAGQLPRTGLDVAPIAALGLAFLLAGLVLRRLAQPVLPRPGGPQYIDLRRSRLRVYR